MGSQWLGRVWSPVARRMLGSCAWMRGTPAVQLARRKRLVEIGDKVYVMRSGELRFVPPEAHDQGPDAEGGRFLGEVAELASDPEDTIIALEPPTPNTAPGRSTIRTLKQLYG